MTRVSFARPRDAVRSSRREPWRRSRVRHRGVAAPRRPAPTETIAAFPERHAWIKRTTRDAFSPSRSTPGTAVTDPTRPRLRTSPPANRNRPPPCSTSARSTSSRSSRMTTATVPSPCPSARFRCVTRFASAFATRRNCPRPSNASLFLCVRSRKSSVFLRSFKRMIADPSSTPSTTSTNNTARGCLGPLPRTTSGGRSGELDGAQREPRRVARRGGALKRVRPPVAHRGARA